MPANAAFWQFVAEKVKLSKLAEPANRISGKHAFSFYKARAVVKSGNRLVSRGNKDFAADTKTHTNTSLYIFNLKYSFFLAKKRILG